jgi:Mor family transcriptional regulator
MSGTTFADELLAAMPTPAARLACLSLLAKYAGTSVYLPANSKAERRSRVAAHMLENGMNTGEAVQALRTRFGVSERTAWRDVANAPRHLSEGNDAIGQLNGSPQLKGTPS